VAVVWLVVTLILTPALAADDLPELQFEKYELPNGLDVILHEDHTIPMVAVNVWYHTGSKNETPGRTGFAHLFEHMMFQGSEHFNRNFTEGIVKYGGVRNGSTNTDCTNYWENMPSNYLEKTLWLEADRMGYLLPAVTQERLDVQRSVVMNEKRQNTDDQPYGRVEEISQALLYPPNHPYSWTTIGRMEDLQAASLDDVKEFFRRHYTPNNASLCIAGDFEPDQAKEWVEKYFGPIPPGPPVERMETWIPELTTEIRTTMRDEVELPRLYMTWHTPPYYAPGDAEFDLLAAVLSSGKSSRLYKALVYDQQMAQNVTVFQSSMEIGSTFRIIVTAKEGHTLEEIEREVDRILDDVLSKGIGSAEFERAKISWEANFVRRLENIGGFGGRADQLNSYNIHLGDPGNLLWDKARYTSATISGVLDYARKYLKKDARLIVYVLPHGQPSAMDKGTDMAIEPGPQPEPSFTPPSIQTASLSNGMDVYLVENHQLPLIHVSLQIRSGWACDPSDRPGTASLTAELLNEGTKSRSALAISDEARDLAIGFSTTSSYDHSMVNLNTLKRSLDPALELMADVVVNPTFPEEELQRQKAIYLGRIRQEASRAFAVAAKTFQRELYGRDHPYGQPYTGTGTVESINAINRVDLENFYQAYYRPNNAAAIVVGDITLDQAVSKLENALKKWKRGEVAAATVPTVTPLRENRICIVDLPGASQSTIIIGNLTAPRSDPSFLDASVMTEVLGGGPTGRLYKNLREEKGYTYGAYAAISARRGQGMMRSYAQVQKDVTKEAVSEFIKELKGIGGSIPISETELADSKDNLIKGFPQDFQSIGGVAGQLSAILTLGLPITEWQTYAGRVGGVDVTRATQAARNWIASDGLLIVIVGDRSAIEDQVRELNLGEVYFSSVD